MKIPQEGDKLKFPIDETENERRIRNIQEKNKLWEEKKQFYIARKKELEKEIARLTEIKNDLKEKIEPLKERRDRELGESRRYGQDYTLFRIGQEWTPEREERAKAEGVYDEWIKWIKNRLPLYDYWTNLKGEDAKELKALEDEYFDVYNKLNNLRLERARVIAEKGELFIELYNYIAFY